MILLVPAYPHPDRARRGEIELCLRANLANPEISRVLLFGDLHVWNPKLTVLPGTHRPSFQELFAAAADFPGEAAVVANADIYFDATIALAKDIAPSALYALSRWCPETQQPCSVGSHGADAWVFRAPLPDGFCTALAAEPRQIRPGMPFCDQRLARMAIDSGLTVTNPCLSMRAWHMHATALRTYTHADTIAGPYAWVPAVMRSEISV